ncbi:hypothetical protein AALA21_04565 [Eggerthellaceae bacterium 3-80]|nr:hypothetical protein D7W09_03205 [bacterium D16-34]
MDDRKDTYQGLLIASWISAIALVLLCDLLFPFEYIGYEMHANSHVFVGASEVAVQQVITPALLVLVPILQVVSIIFAVVAATKKTRESLRFSRSIMLVLKLGLIPFFLMGGIVILAMFIFGLHPLFAVLGWGLAAIMALMGWTILLTGSSWAIATAIQLYKMGHISSGELAAHIILQIFFVADVVDAIVIFVRSRSLASF